MSVQEIVARLLAEARSAWRFRWYGAAVAWLVCLAGWAWAVSQPNVYEAMARVYVDTSSVLRPILNNQIVPPDLGTQLAYVRQALLGREHLERVARETSVDLTAVTEAQRERVLAGLRTGIAIRSGSATNTVYNISYRHSNREVAVAVVRTLLNSLVETTLGANQEGSDTAEKFLDERILEYENRLQQAEAALAEFKKRNADRLPGSEGDYFERMATESASLKEAEKQLQLALTRRDRLQAQLESQTPVVSVAGADAQPPPNSIDARIQEHRRRLDSLLLEFTERHPDVINVRETLARLEQQRGEQLAALGVENPDQELSGLDLNPIYQSVRIALNEIEVEIDALRADVAERRRSLGQLQALIDEVPEVEAELTRLNRDYDVIYDQYQALVRSRETQHLTRKAADTDTVDFRVIDPPLANFEPVAPNRMLLFVAAFVVALGAGGGLVWLLAQLRPVFSNVGTLREVCELPVLGIVSRAWEAQYRARKRTAVVSFACVMGCLGALLVFAIVIETMGGGVPAMIGLS